MYFLNCSHCLLPATFFSIPIRSNWSGAWKIAPKIRESAFDSSLRLFRRTQALTLLHDLVLTHKASKDSQTVELMKDLEGSILKELRGMGEGDIKPRFLHELLRLLHVLMTSNDAADKEEAKKVLEEFRVKFPMTKHSTDVKKTWRKLAQCLNLNPVGSSGGNKNRSTANGDGKAKKTGENGTEQSPKNSDNKKKKKKKKGRNVDAQKERKRQKEHAMLGQFEGMDMPTFAEVSMTDNLNFTAKGDEAAADKANQETPKGKKKKQKRSSVGEGETEVNGVSSAKKVKQNGTS